MLPHLSRLGIVRGSKKARRKTVKKVRLGACHGRTSCYNPAHFRGGTLPGASKSEGSSRACSARIAQLVEQRIENPRVGGSNPPPGTIIFRTKSSSRNSTAFMSRPPRVGQFRSLLYQFPRSLNGNGTGFSISKNWAKVGGGGCGPASRGNAHTVPKPVRGRGSSSAIIQKPLIPTMPPLNN